MCMNALISCRYMMPHPKKNAYEFAKCRHLFFKDPKPKKVSCIIGHHMSKVSNILLLAEHIVFTTEDGHKPNWVTLIRKIEICMNQRLDGYG